MSTSVAIAPALEQLFRSLADEWKSATRFSSALSAASCHPSYRAIVALGTVVVPLILAALAERPDPWFSALRELTGSDPVPPLDRGRPAAAAECWLSWGRERGSV